MRFHCDLNKRVLALLELRTALGLITYHGELDDLPAAEIENIKASLQGEIDWLKENISHIAQKDKESW